MTASTSEESALIGGIYSNHLALAAALSDISSRNIGSIYCLGDLGAFGPHPDRIYPLQSSFVTSIVSIPSSSSFPIRRSN